MTVLLSSQTDSDNTIANHCFLTDCPWHASPWKKKKNTSVCHHFWQIALQSPSLNSACVTSGWHPLGCHCTPLFHLTMQVFSDLLSEQRLSSISSPGRSRQRATASPRTGSPSAPWAGWALSHGLSASGTRSLHASGQACDARFQLPTGETRMIFTELYYGLV